jgi:hypothetical protein
MTELYTAVRDALARSVVPMVAVRLDRLPDLPRPWYLPAPPPWKPDPVKGRAALLELGRMVPGSVVGYD